jgi:hypothetical protein
VSLDIENKMVIDRLWKDDKPKVVGECEGCQEEIYANEDYFYLPLNGEIYLHQNHECIHQYIIDISISVEGED